MKHKIYHKTFSGADVSDPVQVPYAKTTKPTLDEIQLWEADNFILPKDYVAFLIKYNGGYIYPASFKHNTYDPTEFLEIGPITTIDLLFNWETFKEENSYNDPDWGQRMVAIGFDVTTSLIGLSVEKDTVGNVLYWWRNIDGWDDEDEGAPIPVGTIAILRVLEHPTFGLTVSDN